MWEQTPSVCLIFVKYMGNLLTLYKVLAYFFKLSSSLKLNKSTKTDGNKIDGVLGKGPKIVYNPALWIKLARGSQLLWGVRTGPLQKPCTWVILLVNNNAAWGLLPLFDANGMSCLTKDNDRKMPRLHYCLWNCFTVVQYTRVNK